MIGIVYIVTNEHHITFHTGVTSNLEKRILEHKEKHFKNSFTARYNLLKLVYYEELESMQEAIKERNR